MKAFFKLVLKKIKGFFNWIFSFIVVGCVYLAMKVMLGIKLDIDSDVKELKRKKQPFVILCAHPSELDAAPLMAAILPRTARIVAGERQLYKPGRGKLLRIMRCIPKKQFLTDVKAIKSMVKTIHGGEILGMMPEGRVSLDGTPSPIDFSTAKLVKTLKKPVVACVPHGTYFVCPPYNRSKYQFGKVRTDVRLILTEEETETLTLEEIYASIVSGLNYNESQYAVENGSTYGSSGELMKDVSNIFYRCPKCKALRTIRDDGRGMITCTACGLEMHADRNMQFKSCESNVPANIYEWNVFQKNEERNFFENPDNCWNIHAKKSVLRKLTDPDFEPADEGVLRLDRNGFHYVGTEETLEIPLENIAGVSANYHDGTITVFRSDYTRMFKFDCAQVSAQFVNSLMVLREMYL